MKGFLCGLCFGGLLTVAGGLMAQDYYDPPTDFERGVLGQIQDFNEIQRQELRMQQQQQFLDHFKQPC